MYCVKCRMITKDKTDATIEPVSYKTKTGKILTRYMRKSTCAVCEKRKTMFVKITDGGAIDIHALIGRLPRPNGGWTLPGHKYTGPYNPLHLQLDENDRPLPGQEPYNQVDSVAMKHDICYRDHEDDKHGCDRNMLDELRVMQPSGVRETIDRAFVRGVIGAKHKLGLGKKSLKH